MTDYCHHINRYELMVGEAKNSELFYNKSIDRMRYHPSPPTTVHTRELDQPMKALCPAGRVSDELLGAILKALEERGV